MEVKAKTIRKKRTPKVEKVKKVKEVKNVEKVKKEKKFFSMDLKRYEEIKDFLKMRGDEFYIVNSGTTEKMIYKDRTYVPLNTSDMIGKGFHLSNIVRRDIKAFIDSGKHFNKRMRDYTEQKFNLNAIEKNIGNLMISIDINDCYWQTAYNLGYITEKTYSQGLKNKSWKTGRNASIGSLAKSEIVTMYKNGEVAKDSFGKPQKRLIEKDIEFQNIRHNIVGYVCDVFIKLANILKDDFCMALTDCVFTTFDKKKVVEDFFASLGYSCKHKTIEFTLLNKKERVVEWVELKETFTTKYYIYSEAQILK